MGLVLVSVIVLQFSPSPECLDGAVPAELARVDPDRVADAARRRVSNAW